MAAVYGNEYGFDLGEERWRLSKEKKDDAGQWKEDGDFLGKIKMPAVWGKYDGDYMGKLRQQLFGFTEGGPHRRGRYWALVL